MDSKESDKRHKKLIKDINSILNECCNDTLENIYEMLKMEINLEEEK